MTWTAAFSLQTRDDYKEITATSADEVERALAELLEAHYIHTPTIHIVERPTFGPAQLPDHGLKLDICHTRRLGALAYVGEVPDEPAGGGAFITLATEPVPDPPTLYQDRAGDLVYPPNAVIPLDAVERAVIEFWERGGQRPESVAWQPVESW